MAGRHPSRRAGQGQGAGRAGPGDRHPTPRRPRWRCWPPAPLASACMLLGRPRDDLMDRALHLAETNAGTRLGRSPQGVHGRHCLWCGQLAEARIGTRGALPRLPARATSSSSVRIASSTSPPSRSRRETCRPPPSSSTRGSNRRSTPATRRPLPGSPIRSASSTSTSANLTGRGRRRPRCARAAPSRTAAPDSSWPATCSVCSRSPYGEPAAGSGRARGRARDGRRHRRQAAVGGSGAARRDRGDGARRRCRGVCASCRPSSTDRRPTSASRGSTPPRFAAAG